MVGKSGSRLSPDAKRRILRRYILSYLAVLVGAVAGSFTDSDFRALFGEGLGGTLVFVCVPPFLLALEKWLRERQSM